jgi:hypothetical protein
MIDMSKTVGPYVGVAGDKVIKFDNSRSFRVLLYGAYNALGLIGSEYNGIAVLDEDNKTVVADNIEVADSGYFGPTAAQKALFDTMTGANFSFQDLQTLVNNAPRARTVL